MNSKYESGLILKKMFFNFNFQCALIVFMVTDTTFLVVPIVFIAAREHFVLVTTFLPSRNSTRFELVV